MNTFPVTRIFTDENGDSHFEMVEYPLTNGGPIGFLSDKIAAHHIVFRKVVPEYDYDFHTAPARQFIILLDGKIEIETSLDAKKQFSAGDILQVEDVTGKGHRTKNLQSIVRRSIFIPF